MNVRPANLLTRLHHDEAGVCSNKLQTMPNRHVISTATFDFAGSIIARKLMRTCYAWHNPGHTTGLPALIVEVDRSLDLD